MRERLTDEEIDNGISWCAAHGDEDFTLTALTELRALRALLATPMPVEIRYATPTAMKHHDGVWVEASGISGCWKPDAALALGAALIRAARAARAEEGK